MASAAAAFLPFLPQDNAAGSGDALAEEAVELISRDLGSLLAAPSGRFWAEVDCNDSLCACLDSYLRFRRRGHDLSRGPTAPDDDSPAALLLARRVFMVLFRMASPELGASQGPAPQRQADVLSKRRMLDFARLLDVAAIYGRDNPELTQRLLANCHSRLTYVPAEIAAAAPVIAGNLQEVEQRCSEALQQLRSSKGQNSDLVQGVADGIAYVEDVAVTLSLFAELLPPAAGLLLGDGSAPLGVLGSLYNKFLPDAAGTLKDETATNEASLARTAVECLAWTLIKNTFLREAASPTAQQATEQGERLLASLGAAAGNGTDGGTLLEALHAHWGAGDRILTAARQGTLALDDAQLDYLLALLDVPDAASKLAALSLGGSSGSGTSQAEPGVSGDPDTMAPLIAQVKEMLPDYGDGFVEAALEANGCNVERTLNCLLEGSLPAEIASIDPALPRGSPALPSSAKGKAPALAVPPSSGVSWAALRAQGDQGSTVGKANQIEPAASRPKKGVDRSVKNILDQRGQDRNTTRRAVLARLTAMELEYEDEYDDSFDDLAGGVADGATEAEGEGSEQKPAAPSAGTASTSGPQRKGKPMYVLDGKVYNYKKEGARQVSSQAEAQNALKEEAQQVMGLGPGGNKGPQGDAASATEEKADGSGERGRGRVRRSGGGGAPGPGRGRGSHAHKDKNKAAIGNHHRKDRAMKKQGV